MTDGHLSGGAAPSKLSVLHMIPNFQIEGGQVLSLRVMQVLPNVRHVVAAPWSDTSGPLMHQFENLGASPTALGHSLRLPFVTAWKLAQLVRRHRIDLIQTDTTGWATRLGILAGRISRRPVLNVFHTERYPNSLRPDEWRAAKGVVKAVVGVSRHCLAEWCEEIGWLGLSKGQTRVIHPGLPDRFFRDPPPAAVREEKLAELGVTSPGPGRPRIVTIVARIAREKSHRFLVPVAKELVLRHPDLVVLVVGDGPERGAFEADIRAAGLRQHFHLAGSRGDVAEILSVSDAFVFPSTGEGFGMALLEARAAGLPAAAFGIPSVREFFRDGQHGILTPPGDTAAMVSALDRLLGEPGWRTHLREGATLTRETYSVSRSAREFREVWSQLASGADVLRG